MKTKFSICAWPSAAPARRLMRQCFMVALLVICVVQVQPVAAQIRSFPDKTKVGMLQMGNFPEAQLDGKRILFAPGVRIMNVNNTTVLPVSLQQPVRIRYRLDALQQIDLAWILSAEEARAASEK
jgi:hypothetical protein